MHSFYGVLNFIQTASSRVSCTSTISSPISSLPIGLAEFQYVTRDVSKQGASNIFPFAHISFPLLVCMCTMFRRELTCKGFEVCFPSWNVYCGPQPLSPLTVCLLVSAPADTVSESDSSLAGPSPLLSHVVLQV